MTDDEKRALKGQVLLEAKETEEHLSALSVRASRLGRLLEYLGKSLQGNPANALQPPEWDRRLADTPHKSLLETAREALAHDDLLALIHEYQSTAKRLEDLNVQKRDLGIADRIRTQ